MPMPEKPDNNSCNFLLTLSQNKRQEFDLALRHFFNRNGGCRLNPRMGGVDSGNLYVCILSDMW
jgi:hypothetical protein